MLDLDDVRWELGRFGKLNIRHGKGSRRRGLKPRLVPLINGADQNVRWFIEDVWGQLGSDHTWPGAPLFPSERKNTDGSCSRVAAEVFRYSLAQAAARHLPAWAGRLTPHVLRHYCASQLYQLPGRDEPVRHPGATWSRLDRHHRPPEHVHGSYVEDAWAAGQQRAADRWKGLA
jgi:integrase